MCFKQVDTFDGVWLVDDDYGLYGIEMTCVYRDSLTTSGQMTSSYEELGDWQSVTSCPANYYMVAFNMKVHPKQSSRFRDDTASNSVKFRCRGPGLSGATYQEVEGAGGSEGSWGSWSSECPSGSAICSIKTRFDSCCSGDDTLINDSTFDCCNY